MKCICTFRKKKSFNHLNFTIKVSFLFDNCLLFVYPTYYPNLILYIGHGYGQNNCALHKFILQGLFSEFFAAPIHKPSVFVLFLFSLSPEKRPKSSIISKACSISFTESRFKIKSCHLLVVES